MKIKHRARNPTFIGLFCFDEAFKPGLEKEPIQPQTNWLQLSEHFEKQKALNVWQQL